MNLTIGSKVIITTTDWFYGADGMTYRAVYGTVHAVMTDKDALGISTNRNSTNWYVQIGSMIVAGCRIHYAVKSDSPPPLEVERWCTHEGKTVRDRCPVAVYNAERSE